MYNIIIIVLKKNATTGSDEGFLDILLWIIISFHLILIKIKVKIKINLSLILKVKLKNKKT